MEKEWETNKKIHNWDYSDKCKNFITEAQSLNNEFRKIQTNIEIIILNNLMNRLMQLEENNYKLTISIFLSKLKKFELLKKDEDEYEFSLNENEVSELKMKQKEIREMINDIITEIKYYN